MDVFTGMKLSSLVDANSRMFQGLLPELIKKLILCSSNNIKGIRMPSKDDIWSPGFDGLVEISKSTTYVCAGKSVWEFGTNKDFLKKINDDWEKRTTNPLGIAKQETEIYFVIPHIWAYDNQGWSISKWETEHRENWKNVHIYDANVLSDWLNSEPAVCAWLIEQVNENTDLDFITIPLAWERFASKTSPSFSHSLFLEGREAEESKLDSMWESPIIKVKADTTLDAYGFCLSTILNDTDRANTVIVINNHTTYKDLSRFCRGKTFLLNFQLECDVITGNRVILCYNKEAQTVKADIELRQLSKTLFDKAIKDMQILDRQVGNLYENTHGNLLSLIRIIPGNTTIGSPKWTNQNRIDLLAPVLLLRDYDSKNESEQNLVSYLAGEKYDVIFEKYNAWLRLEDSPLKFVDDHIVLVNFEEAWEVLQLTTSSPIFDRFVKTIGSIIISSRYNEKDNPNYIDSRSKRHLNNLFLDLIYFSYNEDGKNSVDQAVIEILETTPFSNMVLEHLSLLAEAAPVTVMSFLEKEKNGFVKKAFDENNYLREYCKILFALDELVLHEKTGVRACDYLFYLCVQTRDRNFSNSNSPKDSLLTALCLWNYQSVLSVSEKVALIKKYSLENEEYQIPFTIDLLFKDRIFYGIRNGAKAFPNTPIYTNELYDAINDLATITFQKSIEQHNLDNLKRLLLGYHHFCVDTLLSASRLFDANDYSIEELVPLNSELRERLFYARKNEGTKPWLPALEAWVKVTTPADNIGQIGWLFYEYYHCYLDEASENEDLEENQKSVERKREEVLSNLVNEKPTEVVNIIRCSGDDISLGGFYAHHVPSEILLNFAKEATRLNKKRLLYGLIDGSSLEDCIAMLDALPLNEQCLALQNMYRRDIMDILDTPDKERAFWMHQHMFEYDAIVYQKLLMYNPFNLIEYFAYLRKEPLTLDIDKIFEIFDAILSFESTVSSDYHSYGIDEIIYRIDQEGYYTERWAEICAALYDRELMRKYPNVLKKYYFENPALLCKKIVCHDGNSHSMWCFYFEYELPDYAYNESDALAFFVKTLIESQSDGDLLLSILGNILGRGPNGSDGIFPHENVRVILEKYRGLQLNQHVRTGKLNSRGVRVVGDGAYEKNHAQRLMDDAKRLEVLYPETAQLLRWLSSDYAADGKRDHLFSEIGMSAW